jgi:adenosylmethionine-8-amino-7-oxononanoate aminotransferase
MSALEKWDQKHVWHPFTQHAEWGAREPIIIRSAKGVWLTDTRGRRFMDGVSSLWVNVWGHNHPVLNKAVQKQLSKIAHSTFLGLTHEPAIRLAKKLTEIAPQGLSRVFYSDNGSTAVEVALKMAYQYWQLTGHPRKTKFVSMKEGYHGDTLGAVSVGGIDLFHERFRGLLFRGWQVTPPRRHPGGSKPGSSGVDGKVPGPRITDFRGDDMERILRRHHRSIAAVVMEPLIQGASGMLLMPKGYLAHVANICRQINVLLIIDEVATGFGRTGKMFACEHEGVTPDFLCVAKSLTGGYLPLAATLAKERIYRAFLGRYDEFKTFFHGHTYTANPLACAVALANLDLYRKKDLLANVRHLTLQMAENFSRLKFHPHIKDIRQVGLMAGIELVKKKDGLTRHTGALSHRERDGVRHIPYPPGARMGLKVCDAAFKRGVWLRPLGDVVVLMPPLAITERELSFLLRVVEESIEEVTKPHPPCGHPPVTNRDWAR